MFISILDAVASIIFSVSIIFFSIMLQRAAKRRQMSPQAAKILNRLFLLVSLSILAMLITSKLSNDERVASLCQCK